MTVEEISVLRVELARGDLSDFTAVRLARIEAETGN